MILFDEPHLRIEFKNVPCRHLVIRWSGRTRPQQYKDGIQTILKCCKENEIRKVVCDIREQEFVDRETREFGKELIDEFGRRYGPFYQAIVLPGDVFVQFNIDNVSRQHMDRAEQFFSNDKDALSWLTQIEI